MLRDRAVAYMSKAIREAKLETSWTRPDDAYEHAVAAAINCLFDDVELTNEIAELARRIMPFGACNSIAQVAIKLASPGVPDVYQGSELWDTSLVDPDNRRPVDYARRRAMLDELARRGDPTPDLARELVSTYEDGRIKLHVTRAGLHVRRAQPQLFLDGAYRPISAGEHIIAFERSRTDARLICIVPRLTWTLTGGQHAWPSGEIWGKTSIEVGASARWRNVFTGEHHGGATLALRDVLGVFPIAWLVATGRS
jgi:(1->4)-alpha-D-glucan 1-alpha-D-glucosylmutase